METCICAEEKDKILRESIEYGTKMPRSFKQKMVRSETRLISDREII